MTTDELNQLLLSKPGYAIVGHSPPPRPKPQPIIRDEPLGEDKREARYATRVVISFTSFRRRLLDEDNCCTKYFTDGLRYAGIISDDDPSKVSIQVSQQKVTRKEDERTEITITPLPRDHR